jgi:hypothetical protein
MAEQKKTIKVFGNDTVVVDVPIVKADEHFNEYELEDGSVLRVKNVPHSMLRVDEQYDPNGNPVYIVLTTPVVSVISARLSSTKVIN